MRCPPGWTGLLVAIVLLLWIAAIEYAEHGVGSDLSVRSTQAALQTLNRGLQGELDKHRLQLTTLRAAMRLQPALGAQFTELVYALQTDNPAITAGFMLADDFQLQSGLPLQASDALSQHATLLYRTLNSRAQEEIITSPLRVEQRDSLLMMLALPTNTAARSRNAPLAIVLQLDWAILLQQAGFAAMAKDYHLALYSAGPGRQSFYHPLGDQGLLAAQGLELSHQTLGLSWQLRVAHRSASSPAEWNWLLGGLMALLGGLITYYYARSKERIRYLALHDALTGLPNKRLLQDRVNQAQHIATRSSKVSVFMYLDLDNFKPINDQHGHKMGDCALREVAQRLSECIRKSDTVARISGDEFAVVLTRLNHRSEAVHIAQKIQQAIDRPLSINNRHVEVGVSIGLYTLDRMEDFDTVLSHADTAMYHAKHNGKHSYAWYYGSEATQLSFGALEFNDEQQQA